MTSRVARLFAGACCWLAAACAPSGDIDTSVGASGDVTTGAHHSHATGSGGSRASGAEGVTSTATSGGGAAPPVDAGPPPVCGVFAGVVTSVDEGVTVDEVTISPISTDLCFEVPAHVSTVFGLAVVIKSDERQTAPIDAVMLDLNGDVLGIGYPAENGGIQASYVQGSPNPPGHVVVIRVSSSQGQFVSVTVSYVPDRP